MLVRPWKAFSGAFYQHLVGFQVLLERRMCSSDDQAAGGFVQRDSASLEFGGGPFVSMKGRLW